MTNRVLYFFILAIGLSGFAQGQDKERRYTDRTSKSGVTHRYERPKAFDFFKKTPRALATTFVQPFQKENLWKTGTMIGGTALLVAVDQPVIDGAQQFGKYIGLGTDRGTKALLEFQILGQSAPIEVPTSFSSGVYYIGEGWPTIFTTLGFYTTGLIKKDDRALQTASQLVQTMIGVGIFAQFIKRTTGRESPFKATQPGGKWKPFPNPKDYAAAVPEHDAFPSGHMATLAGTFTVIVLNYPDVKILRPIAVGTMALVGFQMMNNGVHWISDYPIAIAIGYGLGKIAVNQGRKEIVTDELSHLRKKKSSWKLAPDYSPFGAGMLSLTYKFR
jgi:hypothetical protein